MYILICEFRPIQSVNKTQCVVHFWSSEVQLQNKSDFRLQSTHVLLHELVPAQPQRWPICSRECQSLSVHPCGVHICQAEREQSGGLWVEWREHRLVMLVVIRNCCHCCCVPQLNTVGVIRNIICSCMWTCMMLSIGWEGCMCEITQFIAVADVDMPFDKCIL